MKFLLWLFYVPLSVVFGVLAFPMSPVIAIYSLFGDQSKFSGGVKCSITNFWYWPFLTMDNGIEGDKEHLERWGTSSNPIRRFLRRTAWMWRNRGYNASYYWFGVDYVGADNLYLGTLGVDSNPRNQGLQFYITPDGYWGLFMYLPYKIPSSRRGLRVYLGWKMKNRYLSSKHERGMLAFHINPLFPGSHH